MLDEADYDREDAAPIDMLESYFAAHGWEHERQDDEVVAKVKGSWTQYELRALWREDDSVIQFLAFPDVRVTEDRRVSIYEAIGLINEQMWVGHFDLWTSEGMVMFRHALMLSGGVEASGKQCEALLDNALEACERYFSAFQFVVWAGKPAREALSAAMFETSGEA